MNIRIRSLPPGEAPEEVRHAWIGLQLPVTGGLAVFQTSQVLSGPRSIIGALIGRFFGKANFEKGYAVETVTAIEILRENAPEAADWWIKNTPHLVQPGKYLVFHSSVCEPVLW